MAAQETSPEAAQPTSQASREAFIEELRQLVEANQSWDNPFTQALARGELSRDDLKNLAIWFYHFTSLTPRVFGTIYANSPDRKVRRAILMNLIDEDTDESDASASHPELAMRFCEALGLTREEVEQYDLWPEWREVADWRLNLAATEHSAVAMCTLSIAGESQFQRACARIAPALRKHYQMSARDIESWAAHIEADLEHSATAFDVAATRVTDPELQERLKARLLEYLGLWRNNLWGSLWRAAQERQAVGSREFSS